MRSWMLGHVSIVEAEGNGMGWDGIGEVSCVPTSSYSACALSCCRRNLAHLANSSCEEVVFSSRLRRRTEARRWCWRERKEELEEGR